MAPTPTQARAGAHKSWARTADRSARTANGTAAFLRRFENEVDPDGTLDPAERTLRVEHARKAYFLELAAKSARARKAKEHAAEQRRSSAAGDGPAPSVVGERGTNSGEAA